MLLRIERLLDRRKLSLLAGRCVHERRSLAHKPHGLQRNLLRRNQHTTNVTPTTHSQVITTKRKQTAATGEPNGGDNSDGTGRLGSRIAIATGGEAPDRPLASSSLKSPEKKKPPFNLADWFNDSNVLLNSEYDRLISYDHSSTLLEHETIEMLSAMTWLGLRSIPKEKENLHSKKSNLILQGNEHGSQYDIDRAVFQVVRETGANLITFDRQDAEELLGSLVEIAENDTSEAETTEENEAYESENEEVQEELDSQHSVQSPFTTLKMYLSNTAHHAEGFAADGNLMNDFSQSLIQAATKKGSEKDTPTVLHIRSVHNLTATTSGSVLLAKLMKTITDMKAQGVKLIAILSADASGVEEVENLVSSMGEYLSLVNVDFHRISSGPNGHQEMRIKEINTRRIMGITNNRMGQKIDFNFPRYSHFQDVSLAVLDLPDIGKTLWSNHQLHHLTGITLGSIIQRTETDAIPTVSEEDLQMAYSRCGGVFPLPYEADERSHKAVDLDPKHYNRYERKLLPGVVNPGIF